MTSARTYLDWNATAPLRPEARGAMVAAMDVAGNPSSVHAEGRRARAIVEEARENVALLVNAMPSEVVFTSSATEANAWVIAQRWNAVMRAGIEHDSVVKPIELLGRAAVELPVDAEGVVELSAIGSLATPGRTLLALQLANNETGVVQPVADAAARARERGIAVHCDAVQGAGRLPVDFAALGVDTLSLSAHKLGGPKGVGALVIRDGFDLTPMLPGGQERRRRAGTENVPAIAGFGAAARAAARDLAAFEHVRELRDRLECGLRNITPEAVVIGPPAERLPNTSCIALPGALAETLVIQLDLAGVAVSAGAACSSGKVGPSRVLAAMGLAPDLARGAIRVSIGPTTKDDDIAAFLSAWRDIAQRRGETRKVA